METVDKAKKNISMPVLDLITDRLLNTGLFNLEKIIFVCVQHLLYTTTPLFDSLIKLGAAPERIFLLGKQYSTCQLVAEELLNKGIRLQKINKSHKLGEYAVLANRDIRRMLNNVARYIASENDIRMVVVLDDGGKCLDYAVQDLPTHIPLLGIEQTTAGFFNPNVINASIPIIDVATSAAKSYLESDLIVNAILLKMSAFLPKEKNKVCGVVGFGVIGRALSKRMLSLGYTVLVFDKYKKIEVDNGSLKQINSLDKLINMVDYVYGCTGADIMKDICFEETIKHDKVFVSCTSEDKEFLSFLNYLQIKSKEGVKISPLKDVYFQLENGARITIASGGFPINFDGSGFSVSTDQIQLTRALFLAGIVQGVQDLEMLMKNKLHGRVMLCPLAQKFIVKEWLKTNDSYDPHQEILAKFISNEWIKEQSGGKFYHSQAMADC